MSAPRDPTSPLGVTARRLEALLSRWLNARSADERAACVADWRDDEALARYAPAEGDDPAAAAVDDRLEAGAGGLDAGGRTSPGERAGMAAMSAKGVPPAPDYTAARQGEQVGPWQLDAVIGTGGMGAVYRAHRVVGGFDQTAALKLRHGHRLDARGAERCRREQQVLARCTHAHIARLLDGGLTQDGEPYIAMEFVDGRDIVAHAMQAGLGLRERVELALQLADALAHAHRHLIVHRDIKPSNVMVSADGGVKLLDFGIAKLLDDTDASLTRSGERLLTPQYAAPEQVRGEAITVATDVYQFGLLLYRLLAGRPAHAPTDDVWAAMRAVCESEPTAPSTASRRSRADQPPDETIDWSRQLAGDLDAIVLKALRAAPEHRYPSIEALASDLRAWLDGRAVTARAGSTSYRVAKTLRRHWVGVSAASVLVVTGVVYALTLQAQSVRLREALAAAQQQTKKAESVSGFLVSLFDAADPDREANRELTVRELIAQGRRSLERSTTAYGEMEPALLQLLGQVSYRLGHNDESITLLNAAIARNATQAPAGADAVLQLPSLHADLGAALMQAGDFTGANTALQIAGANWPISEATRVERGKTERLQAGVMMSLGQVDKAEQHLARALELLDGAPNDEFGELAATFNDLAVLRRNQQRFLAAEALARRAVAAGRAQPELNEAHQAVRLGNLASILVDLQRDEEAEKLLNQALAMQRRVYGEDDVRTAFAIYRLGTLALRRGQYAEAHEQLVHAYQIQSRLLGPMHHDLSPTLWRLGSALQGLGRHEDAKNALLEMLAIDRLRFPLDVVLFGRDLGALGGLLKSQGRQRESGAVLRTALSMLPPDRVEASTVQLEYAQWLLDTGDLQEADRLAGLASATREAAFPEGNAFIAEAFAVRAQVARSAGRHEIARDLLLRAERGLSRRSPADRYRLLVSRAQSDAQ